VRESYIELKTTQFAMKMGWASFKWTSPSARGVPDRLYFKKGEVKIVEFKAPGKKPTKRQKLIHGQLLKQRFKVDIIDGVEAGIKLFDED
jgi:hypothetical protein